MAGNLYETAPLIRLWSSFSAIAVFRRARVMRELLFMAAIYSDHEYFQLYEMEQMKEDLYSNHH